MEFKIYHKIKQFKDIVRDINFKANYKGQGPDGEPVYEETVKPSLEFTGTVKLHGTNAGICYTPEEGIVAQKRGSLLSPDQLSSHFGFNQFVQVTQKEALTNAMKLLWERYCEPGEQITLYGEWAGKGVQKRVAISEIDKSFFYFDCKVYNPTTGEDTWIKMREINIDNIPNVYSIYNYNVWRINIDFNNPGEIQNTLIKITTDVEKKCPVAKAFGYLGVGEGVVWTTFWKGEKYIFKVKGKKHSTSKVKTLASIDPEVLNSINAFVDYACTTNRIEQGIQEIGATEKKHMPDLLRWVCNDIIAEEDNELKANNLEWKQVAREVNNRVRQHFFTKIDTVL